jgi:glycosidase
MRRLLMLASGSIFPYPSGVPRSYPPKLLRIPNFYFLALTLLATLSYSASAAPPQSDPDSAPVVTKIEPPGWWIGLTPDVMLLLSGHHLQATEVTCNLATMRVARTQSSAGGDYLFVWLKIGADTRSGTAVCRIATPTGNVSFELPLAQRASALRKFQGLSQSDVIYLLMPDRFANGDPTNDQPPDAPGSLDRAKPRAYHGGDLRGIRDHLLYLKDLGVTALWLTPVLKNGSAQDYHGYGAVDLSAVDPHLGTLRDYQELISAAHSLGIKVLFDAVVNHTGPNHPWVKNPPLPDWFHGTAAHHDNSSSPLDKSFYGATGQQQPGHDPFETLADPHAPARLSKSLTDGWFFGALPDLNTENPVVAQYLLQNSIWWTETSGLDGYRLDTFPYVPRKFWANWHSGLRRIYPNLTTIGEVFHPDPGVTSFFAGGQKRYDGIDSGASTLFDYPLYFAIRDVLLRGAPVGKIADVLRRDSLYPHPDSLITFFGNHDVARFASEPGSTPAKLELAFALALTLRGIPQLYYGDEIGMTGGGDPENRHDFPGGWAGDSQDAFTAEGRTPGQQKLFLAVQTLLRLRREHPVLARGRLWHLASDDSSYVFERDSDEEKIVVAFNNAAHPREMKILLSGTPAWGSAGVVSLFGAASGKIIEGDLQLTMPAQSLSIFLLD